MLLIVKMSVSSKLCFYLPLGTCLNWGKGGTKKADKKAALNSQINVMLDKFGMTEALVPRISDVSICRKKHFLGKRANEKFYY